MRPHISDDQISDDQPADGCADTALIRRLKSEHVKLSAMAQKGGGDTGGARSGGEGVTLQQLFAPNNLRGFVQHLRIRDIW
jgi:hypothetical protein